MKQVVLITGTSSGLGLNLAVRMASRGAVVYASMRNPKKKAALVKEAAHKGVKVHVRQLDVSNSQSVQECVADIIKQHGHIDVLINNAGAGFINTTEHATDEEVEWVMNVNFMGVVRCTKAVLPHMRKKRHGHIINISSVGGLVGQPFNEIHCAAKFAVEGYTESLASYVQPHFGVKFTLVEPGGIYTEFANSSLKQFRESGGIPNDEYKALFENYVRSSQSQSKDAYQSVDEVTHCVLQCIDEPPTPIRIRTSKWAEKYCSLKTDMDEDGLKQQKFFMDNYF